MTLLIEDQFNRANSASTLGSSGGAGTLDPVAWSPEVGTWGITSNYAYNPSSTNDAVAVIESGYSNVDIRAMLSSSGGTFGFGIVLRYVNSSNYIYIVKEASDDLNIVKKVAGVVTSLLSITDGLLNGMLETRITAINNIITVYQGGVVKGKVIENFNRSATKHGLFSDSNGAYSIDYFTVSTVDVPAELSTDSFNRINSTSLDNTDGAGTLDPFTWLYLGGSVYSSDIVSNAAKVVGATQADPLFGLAATGFNSGININYIEAGTPDVQLFAELGNLGSCAAALVFRYVDANNYWAFIADQGANTRLCKRVGGTNTNVSGVMAGMVANDRVMGVKVAGSTIICEINGLTIFTTSDTVFDTATKHGFMIGSANGGATVDDFQLWVGDPAIPVITQIGPTQGVVSGGTDVTIVGNNFTGATGVTFGATPATSFTVISDKYIEAISPAHAPALLDITVTNADGSSVVVIADQFTFVQPSPLVSSVTPTNGPPAGGTSVVITGAYFTGATSVKFGATEANSFIVNNDGQITAVAPAHASGVIPIIITTPQGSNG